MDSSEIEEFWEKKVKRLENLSDHRPSEKEVLEMLKRSLTSRFFLSTNNVKITDQDQKDHVSEECRQLLIDSTDEILSIKTPDELCAFLLDLYQITGVSVYINNIFALFENGIYEVGSILEDFFTKNFKLGGCQLDCDIFFGN